MTLGMRCDRLDFNLLGRIFVYSLHVFDFVGFEIILGIDWLSMMLGYFVTIKKISSRHPDCSDRVVYTVENPSCAVNTLLGVVKREDELNRVLVVREFGDVFELVVGLPQKRAVEFRIDLVPGAEPVSRPQTDTYRDEGIEGAIGGFGRQEFY